MKAESEMSDMNMYVNKMEMTDTKAGDNVSTGRKARRRGVRRRILASVCAFAIAMLQCAVILTIDTESVHAAGTVDVTVLYKNGKTATKNGKS